MFWTRNGSIIDSRHNRLLVDDDGALNVQYLEMQDKGFYQCWGENEAGTAQVAIWLNVTNKGKTVMTTLQLRMLKKKIQGRKAEIYV